MDLAIVASARNAFVQNPPVPQALNSVTSLANQGQFEAAKRLASFLQKRRIGSLAEIADSHLGMVWLSLQEGKADLAATHLAAAEEMAAPRTRDQVRALIARGWLQLVSGSLEDGSFHLAEISFERAQHIAREIGLPEERAAAAVGQIDATIGVGKHIEAIDLADRELANALDSGIYDPIPALLTLRGFALKDVGYRPPAVETFDAARETLARGKKPIWEARATMGRAILKSYQADEGDMTALDEALAMFSVAERIALRLGAWPSLVEIRYEMARACESLGDPERAAMYRLAEAEAAEQGGRARQQQMARAEFLRTEEERVLVEEGLRVAMDVDPNPFFLFFQLHNLAGERSDLQVIYRNEAARRMVHHEGDVLHLLSELEAYPYCAGFADALKDASQGKPSEDDVEIETAIGRRIFRRRAMPSFNGAVMMMEDVTRFVDAARSIERTSKVKSEFLAHMSHEIRTPLNGVLGLAHLLERSPLDPLQRKWIDGLLASGDLLHRVINDILDLSKIDAGKLELANEIVSYAAIVRETAALHEPKACQKGLRLVVKVDPAVIAMTRGDAPRLKQVLGNLLSNAVRYTEGGEIVLGAEIVPSGVRFFVKDTGDGIAQENQARIFAPFETGGMPESGTGLGLAISRHLVGRMGGELKLTSRPGDGSTFWFELPFVPTEDAEPIEQESDDDVAMRVLLVEDNDVNAMVAIGHLQRLGCSVTRAADGEEALRLAATGPNWDLVLMDVRLPGISGLRTTRMLRKMEGFDRMPIVAMTAGALLEEQDECYAAGMDSYLSKPFRPQDLTNVLRRFAPRRESETFVPIG